MRAKTDAEASARIEAALYASGRPMSVEEIMRASGTGSRTKTAELLAGIIKRTRSALRALEVTELPDGSYVLQLRPEYGDITRRYASRPVLSNAVLKTLSYIAYEQPISSKLLLEARGTGVYAHLKELRQLGYVAYESIGRWKNYRTTEKFQKYFGIRGDDAIKQELFDRVRRTSQRM